MKGDIRRQKTHANPSADDRSRRAEGEKRDGERESRGQVRVEKGD